MLQQSVTIAGGSQIWNTVAIDACPWTRVGLPPFPSTSCTQLIAYGGADSSFRNNPLTVTNFIPTQAMIANGGVVIRLRWSGYNGPAGNVGMIEWVPLVAPPDVTLAVSPSSISENGGVATVTATLSRASGAATTVTVTPVSGFYTVGSDTTIEIAAGSTSNATDTATIAAVDDDVHQGTSGRSTTVTGTAANSMGVALVGASLTLTDDDEKGLALVPSDHLAVTAGSSDSYTVVLTSEPTGAVTVSVASDNADVTANPASLTFDATDWNTMKTVTVSASSDGDDYADAATLTHRATGGGYGGVTGALSVAVADGARIAVPAGTATRTESVYVVNGQRVTVTVAPGVPPGVEIALPPTLGSAVTVSFAPVDPGVPRESGSFRLEHEDERAMVDVTVAPVPSGGVELCLAAPQGIRDAAARSPGRELVLLRHDGTAWTAVSGSAWDATEMRVCASGVTSFASFALGYADRSIEFAGTVPLERLVYTVGEAIADLVLPPVKEGAGDAPVRCCDLTPAGLPPGLAFDKTSRTLSGTPMEVFPATTYAWTAWDADGPASLTFTIAVEHGREKARARLKAVNESVLPELSRALWGSALDAVTGRLESPDAAAPTAAGGLEAAAGFVRAHEGALEEGDVSWKELLGSESFAFGLAGEGGPGAGGVVAWGSGDWRKLSRDEDALDWSGDAFSAHVGVDAALRPDLRGGLAASWFSSDVDYTDRNGDAAVKGSHESRMTALTPYVGWATGRGCGGRPVTAGARSRSWTGTCAIGSGRRKRTAGSWRAPRAGRLRCGPGNP